MAAVLVGAALTTLSGGLNMAAMTEAKLKKWHRKAVKIDEDARKLMAEMGSVMGFECEATDNIDNVLAATENLCDALSQPKLAMWNIDQSRS